MNYLNTVKYDDTKRSYTDSFGYIVAPLKSTRLSVRDNEEVEESKDNIVMLQGGQSGQGVSVSADFSKDANVDITIEPKGTGVVKATGDIVATTNSVRQVRLTSDTNWRAIVASQGSDTDPWLDLRTQNNGNISFHGDQTSYLGVQKAAPTTLRQFGTNADISIMAGSAKKVFLKDTSSATSLSFQSQNPGSNDLNLAAEGNQTNITINLTPKGTGIVKIPAQIQSTYGYMLLTRSAGAGNFAMNVGSATEMQLDSILVNTFGAGYWSGNKTFTNASAVAMKLIVSGRAMPSAAVANTSCYFDTSFKIYNSSNALLYTAGRQNLHPIPDDSTFFSLSPTACIYLNPGEYFRWQVFVVNTGFNIVGDGGSDKCELNICQVP